MDNTSSRRGGCLCPDGCGCTDTTLAATSATAAAASTAAAAAAASAAASSTITVYVTPTTGGQFDLCVAKLDTIENLKKLISKRLKVPKERICLLHRERQLRDGTVQENQLVNGSRLTLLPSVETGLLAQRPEQSVMQALESLNDSQVNDFLSGKAPLNLTMRLGDHMMLIQLQLSTVAPGGSSPSSGSSSTASTTATASSLNASSSPSATAASLTKKRRLSSSSTSETAVSSSSTTTTPSSQEQSIATPVVASSSRTTTTTTIPPASPLTSSLSSPTVASTGTDCVCEPKPVLDTKALAEASRNLTQTLKQLSSEVLTSKSDSIEVVNSLKRRQGAIIESMHHHGKGVYSGTFSGTLNPALQDRYGRPKRDISTIIHILNDLLCATPQYRAAAQEAAKSRLSASNSTSSLTSTSDSSSTAPTSPTSSPSTSSSALAVPGSSSSLSSSSTTTAPAAGSVTSSSNGVPNGSVNDSTTPALHEAESDENRATRGKMERLRLVLGQRRQRRRAMRAQPYPRPGHDHVTA